MSLKSVAYRTTSLWVGFQRLNAQPISLWSEDPEEKEISPEIRVFQVG